MPASTVALVTGASSGIGRATALRLASRGAHLTLVARSADRLDEVAEACGSAGAASVHATQGDVTDDAAMADCVADVVARHGRLDAVVHAAGVVVYGRTEDVPADVFQQVVTTNLLGSATLARHAVPVLRAQRRGVFVQVGSLLGHVAVPEMSPYVVSKWGTRALVRQLQIENRDVPGVQFCDVVPGGVDTPIYSNAANYSDREGRAPFPVSPDRVARVIVERIDRPRRESHVGPLNRVIALGYALTPRVFDALVGPLFRLSASQPGVARADRGNVG